MTGDEVVSAITLRALEGEPLVQDHIRDMVVATAEAIAERQGVRVVSIETTPTSIEVALETGRIQAIGFAAELRRLTTNWYTHKFGVETLWGKPADDDGESWKQS